MEIKYIIILPKVLGGEMKKKNLALLLAVAMSINLQTGIIPQKTLAATTTAINEHLVAESELPIREDDNVVVDVEDINLRIGICNLLGGEGRYSDPENVKLTRRDLRRIRYLSPEVCRAHDPSERSSKVHSIAGLEWAENLEFLSLVNQKIDNIESLRNLTKLKHLNLKNVEIKDLSPLENLINLEEIDLSGAHPDDTTPLSKLKNLRKIILIPENLEFAKNLENLEILNASYGKISDVSPIKGLKKLRELSIDGRQKYAWDLGSGNTERITDAEDLGLLKNLTKLSISSHDIEDISFVKNLTNLTSFHAQNNKIEDFEPLLYLDNLVEVWIQENTNSIPSPTTDKYVLAKEVFDALNKDVYERSDITLIDKVLTDTTIEKFFSRTTKEELEKIKQELQVEDTVENKLFKEARLPKEYYQIDEINEPNEVVLIEGEELRLPDTVFAKARLVQDNEIKGKYIQYESGDVFKIAVLDEDGNPMPNGTLLKNGYNNGNREYIVQNGFITLSSSKAAPLTYETYRLYYDDKVVFSYQKSGQRFSIFSVLGSTYEVADLSRDEISEKLVIRLSQKEAIEKIRVDYEFVLEEGGELPREVLSLLPSSKLVDTPNEEESFKDVVITDTEDENGTYKFQGFTKEIISSNQIKLVGTWKFIKEEKNDEEVIGVHKVADNYSGYKYQISYKVVDEEGNVINEPNLIKIVPREGYISEPTIKENDGIYSYTSDGYTATFDIKLNSDKYTMPDKFSFTTKYLTTEWKAGFEYIYKNEVKQNATYSGEDYFTIQLRKKEAVPDVSSFGNSIDNDILHSINLPVVWDLSNFKNEVGEYRIFGEIQGESIRNPKQLRPSITVKVVKEIPNTAIIPTTLEPTEKRLLDTEIKNTEEGKVVVLNNILDTKAIKGDKLNISTERGNRDVVKLKLRQDFLEKLQYNTVKELTIEDELIDVRLQKSALNSIYKISKDGSGVVIKIAKENELYLVKFVDLKSMKKVDVFGGYTVSLKSDKKSYLYTVGKNGKLRLAESSEYDEKEGVVSAIFSNTVKFVLK